jgi:O-antigen ligase
MTTLLKEPFLLIFGAVFGIYFIALSLKYPILPAAIYPLTFLNATQTTLAVAGISPSKYIGAVLILAGGACFLREIKSKARRNYSLMGLFVLMMLFPAWILLRFLLEGSGLNLVFTFLLNALTIFSIVVIVNTERRKRIMEISLAVTFILLSLGMIAAQYLPDLSILKSLQQGEYSRAVGFVNDPNYGGAFLAIGFAYFFSKAVYHYEVRKTKWFYLSLLLIAITVLSLVLTLSRAALLSVAVCLLTAVLYGRIRFRNLVWLLPFMVLMIVLIQYFPHLLDGIKYRISIAQTDPSNLARIEFLRNGLNVIRENSLWGVGTSTGYHSAFIDVTVFGGVFGLLFFLVLIFWVFRTNARILAVSEGHLRDGARFVVLGLIVFLFNSLFIGMETERIVWFLFGWGMISLILYRKAQSPADPAAESSLQPRASWSRDKQVVI